MLPCDGVRRARSGDREVQQRILIRGPAVKRRVHQFRSGDVIATLAEPDAFGVVQRESLETRLAGLASEVKQIVIDEQDVFVQVIDQPDVAQRRGAGERQLVVQRRRRR